MNLFQIIGIVYVYEYKNVTCTCKLFNPIQSCLLCVLGKFDKFGYLGLCVGTIKGLGRIYQQAGIGAYSSFGFAKVYCNKNSSELHPNHWTHFLKTKTFGIME